MSELELATGPVLRPRLVTLGRVPVGTGGGAEGVRGTVGVGAASLLDMVLIADQMMCLGRRRGGHFEHAPLHFFAFSCSTCSHLIMPGKDALLLPNENLLLIFSTGNIQGCVCVLHHSLNRKICGEITGCDRPTGNRKPSNTY